MFKATARSLLAPSLRAKPNARNPFNCLYLRTIITVKETKFTAFATGNGPGRNGRVVSVKPPNVLGFRRIIPKDLKFATPKELGQGGKGHNPEQLFAMAYAASFLDAIQAAAKPLGKKEIARRAIVRTSVHIGTPDDMEGYGIRVDVKVQGVDRGIMKTAYELCAYSRALAHGAEVKVSLADSDRS